MFQLLISFRKRKSTPNKLRNTAKLDTIPERKPTIASEVSMNCFSLLLKHSPNLSVSPLVSQKQLKHYPPSLKYSAIHSTQLPLSGSQVAQDELQGEHCCSVLLQKQRSKQLRIILFWELGEVVEMKKIAELRVLKMQKEEALLKRSDMAGLVLLDKQAYTLMLSTRVPLIVSSWLTLPRLSVTIRQSLPGQVPNSWICSPLK